MNEADNSNFQKLKALLDGNHDAARFCWDLAFVSEVFDDLYDVQEVTKPQLQDALFTVLTLPSNPFYKANIEYFQPIINVALGHWFAANEMQGAGGLDTEKAHFFRYFGHQVWVLAWAVIHQSELKDSQKYADAVRSMWELSTMESLEGFKNEFRK